MGALPTRNDLLLSLGFMLLALAEIWLTPTMGLSVQQRVVESAALLLVSACFVFRRVRPTAAAWAVMVLLAGVGLTVTESRGWDIAVVMLAMYSAARHSGRAAAWSLLGAGVGYGVLITALEGYEGFWNFVANFLFYLVLMVLTPWAAGLALRRRQDLSRDDADRAVEEERARIARELHDVVGHALGVIVVQAEGERAQLAADASESTRETLAGIARCARDALDDVRRLLVVMRTENALGPQPGLDDVPRLLEGMASAGLPAELVVAGTPRPLPAGVDLSAYRIVQEALTNSLRHSRDARARVVLRYDDDAIDIEVTDDGQAVPSGSSRGFGLLGMRERVALFGGSVDAGPRVNGGFGVHVTLPVGGGAGDGAARSGV
ncbi:sensor histidine kinase [Nocardioides sp. MAHUQ-72]|uniref:sensor histidine kinase n=1 Tax=unclassified Nocardioides TaxID=2615069 RepID=UPI00361F7EDF